MRPNQSAVAVMPNEYISKHCIDPTCHYDAIELAAVWCGIAHWHIWDHAAIVQRVTIFRRRCILRVIALYFARGWRFASISAIFGLCG
jgi:hypothetical protein